ncbi:unnamed protein product [Bursaphelenchus xylophilus]|uniref:(pine wood nematode) hypothetical protein n=1 Tax=Bursaphelenchus xylophilus TaxID=6326 RepID=A0A7I8XLS9_BURXY|nr:unnamed protein product [Bursaphelenchus xylophilus]CAG9090093.1 unnamed protein product [Bursaphelenchus xylophilus]
MSRNVHRHTLLFLLLLSGVAATATKLCALQPWMLHCRNRVYFVAYDHAQPGTPGFHAKLAPMLRLRRSEHAQTADKKAEKYDFIRFGRRKRR